ncbi:hypothetical protein [Streptomyces sp. TRM68416]|uniref:hypothetical protein n=1 Tax=Streptomyces sp. TRM68416 TaxID=2758412 RepID=UPI001661E798|nr:hypothetical protein [Streptomyces sp. TRM68416]MBD0838809.1 hypothetical protein [Streptomyces sp. TRM68416]
MDLPMPAAPSSNIPVDEPLYSQAANRIRDQLREPADLQVAVRIGQRMLDAYDDSSNRADVFAYAQAYGATREALRLLLRALDAEAVDAR